MVGTSLQSANPDTSLMRTSATLAQAYAELVRYRPITEAVIQRLGLERSHEELSSQIVAWVQPNANLLEIRVTDTNPKAAMMIANALAEELIRQSPGSSQGQRRQQQEFIKQQLDELEEKIEKKKQEIAELNDSLADLTSAAEIADTMARIDALEQVASTYRTQYAALLQSYAGDSVNVLSIVEPAVEPWQPIGGKKRLIVAVSAGAGLALALGAAFLIEYLDDTVQKDAWKEETLFDLPVLGTVSKFRRKRGPLITSSAPATLEAEAVRALRTNIALSMSHRPPLSLLITSAGAREGKSTVVANLAVTFAAAGQRVVLVDADLRGPSLHTFFDCSEEYGLAELLRDGHPDLQRALQETDIDNLRLITGGQPPLDPTLLLTSPRLEALLQVLKEESDWVLLDSPPVLLTPDATILAGLVDGTVLVVCPGRTTQEMVVKAKKRLLAYEKTHLLGVAFNRVRLGRRAYYYNSSKVTSWEPHPVSMTAVDEELRILRQATREAFLGQPQEVPLSPSEVQLPSEMVFLQPELQEHVEPSGVE